MFRTVIRTNTVGKQAKRTAARRVEIESLEDRALFSTVAPVAQSPGTSASPGPILTNVAPTFKWSAVSGVSGYQIHIYDKTESKMLSTNVGASVTSYKAAAGALKPGDQFVWNVRDLIGSASSTTTGAVSNYLNFQIHYLPAPTVIGPGSTKSPAPTLSSLTPTFSWKPVTSVTGFSGYQINLYDETSHHFQTFVTSPTATSYKLPSGDLTPGDTYVWNLRLRDGSFTGYESQPYLNFRAPSSTSTSLPAPMIVSPGSSKSPGPTLTTLTPTLQWKAVTGVSGLSGYQINLYNITTSHFVSYKVGASQTHYALPSGALTAGDDYVWNVRVLADGKSGPPSVYAYFVAE